MSSSLKVTSELHHDQLGVLSRRVAVVNCVIGVDVHVHGVLGEVTGEVEDPVTERCQPDEVGAGT